MFLKNTYLFPLFLQLDFFAGKSVVLSHNAEIRMADTKSYIFMYTKKIYQSEFPKELTSHYMVSKKLGNGACGTVYLAFRRKDGKRVAIKE